MSKSTKGFLAVIAGNAIFGFSFLFSKLALGLTIPSVLIAVRFTVAFIVLNLVVLVGKSIKKKDGSSLIEFSLKGKPIWKALLLAFIQPVVYFIAENYGIVYTSSAFAGVIIAIIPLVGVVLDFVFMKSKIRARQLLCAIASVAGVAITTIGAKDMTSSGLGLFLLMIAVFAGAMFYVLSKKAAEEFNPVERTYVMFAVGSVVYIVIAAIQCVGHYEELFVYAVTQPTFWIAILYLAIVSSVMAFLFLNYGSEHVSVSQASNCANITTVISIFAGVFIMKESFTWQQIVGAVIILVSVYAASTSSKEKSEG